MEEHLRALLIADVGVAALVPSSSINWRRHPQGAPLPSIVLRLINDSPTNLITGTTDHSAARVQVSCWAARYSDARAVARAVREALNGRRDGTFHRIDLIAVYDLAPEDIPGDPAGRGLDFAVDYQAA